MMHARQGKNAMSPGLWRRTALIRSGVWETSSRIRLVPVGFQNTRQVRDTDFEIVGDGHLHCNVTHRHATKTVTGWAGPGHVPDGLLTIDDGSRDLLKPLLPGVRRRLVNGADDEACAARFADADELLSSGLARSHAIGFAQGTDDATGGHRVIVLDRGLVGGLLLQQLVQGGFRIFADHEPLFLRPALLRLPDQPAHVVYLDAEAPRDGESDFDVSGPEFREEMERSAQSSGGGWRTRGYPLALSSRSRAVKPRPARAALTRHLAVARRP